MCSPITLGFIGHLLSLQGLLWFYFGVPALFALVSIFHDCTGKLAKTTHALRRGSIFAFWSFAFYLATLLLAFLGFVIPHAGLLAFLIPLAPFVGGLAGSLCWRGKLPGTRKEPKPEEPPTDSSDSD